MIIDIHAHAFADKIARGAMEMLSEKAGLQNTYDGTVSGLKESMGRAGIDISVVQTIATKPEQTQNINNWAAEINKMEGIRAFGTVHPDYSGWKEELVRIKELGLKGIKFHPDYQDFYIDEGKMLPIYEVVIQLDLVMLFHSGVDIGMPKPVHCTPRRISNIIDLFEGHKVVFAHMGAFDMYSNVEEFLVGKDIYLDTSFAISKMRRAQAKRIIQEHGCDRIVFGTDSPWTDQKEEVEFMKGLGLGEEELKKVMQENAEKLLK